MRGTDLFALSAGSFGGGACVLPVVLADVSVATLSPLAVAGAAAAGVGAVVAAAARALVAEDAVERFRDRRWAIQLPFALVLLYLGVTLQFGLAGPGIDTRALYLGLASTGLTALGLAGMVNASQSLHTETVVADSEIYVPLPSTKTDRRARLERRVGGVALVGLGALVGVGLATGESVPLAFLVIGLPGVVQLLRARGSEQALTDAGLRQGGTVHPWDDFEGYELSAEHLVFTQPGWVGDVRIDRERIDDEDDVLSVLSMLFDESS
ncbi:hypothetical protein [Salinibaculum rarum]|uniref:hypothetical protein n=1 Tax=Salinibaculum rarum TaxID=3058903 RepID=UPI0026600163|nr:hypothetical protein [Salinibaculum sp. KK48]